MLYVKRYETDLINYCLRIVINHYAEPFDLNYKKDFFDKYTQISIDKLITSRTTDELIENLKGTEYYEPLKKLKDSPSVTLFDYDLALNQYYFSTMWKKRKKILKKKESAKSQEKLKQPRTIQENENDNDKLESLNKFIKTVDNLKNNKLAE